MQYYPHNDDWVAIAVVGILASTFLMWRWLGQKAVDRQRRYDLVEAALRSPSLGPEAQRELMQALRPRRDRLPFALGWFGLFGGAAWLLTDPRGDTYVMALLATVISFALVTLPFALRELEARRA